MKVSFDFDDTLSRPEIQEYAKELISKGVEVWIVTTRWNRLSKFCDPGYFKLHGNTWGEVHNVAIELGIPLKRVVFTNYQYKFTFFKENLDFIWHLDDNPYEFKPIQTLGIAAIDSFGNWEEKCERLLWKSTLEKKTEN
jgi:hypothetical protein